ncbi:MAG: YgiQ family radical SAM protein [Steroidobacteraceae bacterium]|nr:YgiQ family radical SAM protein [Steroidobacteraceae bacterium]MBP7014101.1 YgiQ family radical SAM protein [Steroidobacteraceae bacterium]
MQTTTRELFSYRKHWAHRFGAAPFLPMSKAEMDALGWDSCDVILVTGDAYVDHPSFGMAIVGRLLEAQGFRVGIIAQPDWHSTRDFMQLGKPNLFFGITGGNMDSMVNRYTADRRVRTDDAYTPHGAGGARPDRSLIVYSQRCREAAKEVPIVIGGIEASLRRIAHFDYWSEKVRRSVLLDAKADLLVFGNAERQICEIAHRLAAGRKIEDIDDLRGTAFVRKALPAGWVEIDSTTIDTPGPLAPPVDPYLVEGFSGASDPESVRKDAGTARDDAATTARASGFAREAVRGRDAAPGAPMDGFTASSRANPEGGAGGSGVSTGRRTDSGGAPGKSEVVMRFHRRVSKTVDREHSVIRMPSYEAVVDDPILYAHASRILHLEANPGNARALVQRHGDTDVWLNPPPIPLATREIDAVYELPYQRVPHPVYGDAKIPAYEMIRFSISIQRGCFGGCTFCSITEHEGRIIQNRSEDSVIREIETIRDTVPGFTGVISDLGGPTANMYRVACKSREIESACRKPSCVYPGICPNLNTDHSPLIRLYRRARELQGVKKVLIASGVRYDLAIESPEYVKELAQHHVGGYLKIAPEALAQGPLSKMMKPGVGTYDRFKELFDKFSKEAGKEQYLIPYFIAAHPGTRDEDMLELALWLKRNGFRADQVQAFLPSPMATATAMYHSGKNPLHKVTRTSEDVVIPKGTRQRRLHKAFLRYHDPNNWPLLREALRQMGRSDLIGNGRNQLVPTYQPIGTGRAHEGQRKPGKSSALPTRARPKMAAKPRTAQPFRTQHTGLPRVPTETPRHPTGPKRKPGR